MGHDNRVFSIYQYCWTDEEGKSRTDIGDPLRNEGGTMTIAACCNKWSRRMTGNALRARQNNVIHSTRFRNVRAEFLRSILSNENSSQCGAYEKQNKPMLHRGDNVRQLFFFFPPLKLYDDVGPLSIPTSVAHFICREKKNRFLSFHRVQNNNSPSLSLPRVKRVTNG